MRKPTILVVDDDDAVRESLVDELCLDYEVEAVGCGREAVRALEHGRYDAVISDLKMPDLDGIAVLERAQSRDPEVIRILLTGYLDPRARDAMLQPNAPYKIGKPWHEEIEVALRRAFEERERRRNLEGSVADAIAVAGIDDEIAAADGLRDLGAILCRRIGGIGGVDSCEVIVDVGEGERVLASSCVDPDPRTLSLPGWKLDAPITSDARTRVRVAGRGAYARDIAEFLCQRARDWTSDDEVVALARKARTDRSAQQRLAAVARHASVGALSAALVHDLASLVQGLCGYMGDIEEHLSAQDDPYLQEAVEGVGFTTRHILQMFDSMRRFVRSSQTAPSPRPAARLAERSALLVRSYIRKRARLRVGEIPDVELEVSEPLFLQVLVNVLRNAADVSPRGGCIDLEVERDGDTVVFSVTDDGPGVTEEALDNLFEPFTGTKEDQGGAGLGLSVAAQIVAAHGGTIEYERAEGRGARFSVSVPTSS